MSGSDEYTSYSNIKRISDEELATLWEAYLADKSRKDLRDKLIVQYIYLTRYVIGRVKNNLPASFTIEDITSYGIEGLINAIERYVPVNNSTFETYALMRIRGSIIDKIRAEDWTPRSVRKKIKEVKDATEILKQKLGRTPTSKEIASALGVEKEKIDQILDDNVNLISVYEKKGQGEESIEIIDTIEDSSHKNPLEALADKDAKKELQEALKRLPERERMIMVLYYHDNLTLKEIGEAVNISESRACQLHAQAIMKLKNILTSNRSERLQQSIV